MSTVLTKTKCRQSDPSATTASDSKKPKKSTTLQPSRTGGLKISDKGSGSTSAQKTAERERLHQSVNKSEANIEHYNAIIAEYVRKRDQAVRQLQEARRQLEELDRRASASSSNVDDNVQQPHIQHLHIVFLGDE